MSTLDPVTLLGLLAACCTTIAFLPQALKVITTKQTQDISLVMYIILCSGILLWLMYGLLNKDLPLIIANSITFLLSTTILALKLKYK